MKLFALLFLVGVASAAPVNDAPHDKDFDPYDYFLEMTEDKDFDPYDYFLQMTEDKDFDPHDYFLQMTEDKDFDPYDYFLEMADEDEIKTEIGKRLRDALDRLLEKIKDAVEHGKNVREDLQQKLKDLKEKMKDLHIEVGEKARELIEKIREKARDFLKKLLEKLGLDEDKALATEEAELVPLDFNIREIFQKLKKALLEKIDKEKLKAKVEELFGKGSNIGDELLKMINEKGEEYKQKLHDLIDRYLGKQEAQHSVSDYWERIKEYFKDLHIDLKEKYSKFGEWVKNVISKGLDKSKSKIENIKEIAREFLDHAKGVSKEVAVEAENFLRPYKEDLGKLYDQVRETVKEIIKNRG